MGTETPANEPFWRVGPVVGTKLPRRMPAAMARRIQRARRRSRRPRDLKAEVLGVGGWGCFSGSEGEETGRSGWALGGMGTGWVGLFCILVGSEPVGCFA